MARKVVKTMANKMAESGREPGKDVLDDTDLSDDPIISAIQTLRISIDDLQHNDDGYGADKSLSAITANTAKTGITSGQASAITANTAKITYDKNLSKTEEKTVAMTITESRGTYALVFTMTHGEVTKAVTLALR